MTEADAPELRVLRLPIVGSTVLAVIALVAAPLTDSLAVLLDGFFSLVYLVTGLFTLHVGTLLRRGGNDRFPFGYAAFEPLANLIKSLLMAGISVFAVWNAIAAIGQDKAFQYGGALLYACVAALINGGMALFVWRRCKRLPSSPLIRGELAARAVDAVTALGVLIAFAIAYWLQANGYPVLARYADPVLTLVMVILTVGVPYSLGKEALSDLLAMAPAPALTKPWERIIHNALHGLRLEDLRIRTLRIGRTWEVTAYVQLDSQEAFNIKDADEHRRRIEQRLARSGEPVHLRLLFSYLPAQPDECA